jgi:hypothetical protein
VGVLRFLCDILFCMRLREAISWSLVQFSSSSENLGSLLESSAVLLAQDCLAAVLGEVKTTISSIILGEVRIMVSILGGAEVEEGLGMVRTG